jgi:hypothetical protein
MLPVFVGFALWSGIVALLAAFVFMFFPKLRGFIGFVLLTPTMSVFGALIGFLGLGWLLDGHLRPEVAMSLTFYFGFVLCGALGAASGLASGFFIWSRVRSRNRQPLAATDSA